MAHQAAEKAIRGLHLALGQSVCGHAVANLLVHLPVNVPSELVAVARALDSASIPVRYPETIDRPPFEWYDYQSSTDAIAYANEIVEFARLHMAEA